MNGAQLRKLAASPEAFRSALLIPAGTGNRRLADAVADFQYRDFAALDPAFKAMAASKPPPAHSRFWIERTKGASKDTDLAIMLLWLLVSANRPLTCQVGAADQNQADELRKAARDIVRLNTWLDGGIEIQASAILGRHTYSRADILTADASGSHGARPHLVILNELTHISNREFAETLMDNASKVPGGVVVIATNAGHTGTWQEQWRDNARQGVRWYFSAYTKPAPWLDEREQAEARRRNSINRYARLWLGQWVGETGAAFTEQEIKDATSLDRPIKTPERGWRYVAGLDLGLKRDHTALAVVGRHVGWTERKAEDEEQPQLDTATRAAIELGFLQKVDRTKAQRIVSHEPGNGRMRLAELLAWRPEAGHPVKIEAVEEAVVELHARLNLAVVAFDPWQAQYLAERLHKRGIRTVAVDFTSANLKAMASETLEAFRERNVEIYGDDELIGDLRKLQIAERSYGFRLESPRTNEGHGDRATALAIGLFAAKRYATVAAGVKRQIRCYTQADMK